MTRRLAVMGLAGATLASGGYVLVYLVRWEWQRATIAGILMLAGEIALVGLLLNGRLARLNAVQPGGFTERVSTRLAGVPEPSSSKAFRWLEPQNDRLGVFIPLLLGVGVLASAIAWAAEQLARRAGRAPSVSATVGALAALEPPARLVPVTATDLLARPGGWDATHR